MSPLVSVLLTLQIGTLTVPPGTPSLPLPDEAGRLAAEAAWRSPSPLGLVAPVGQLPPPTVPGRDEPPGAAPRRSLDWLGALAERLDTGRSGIVHAAAWLASSPVQLDVGTDHLAMRVTLHTP